MTTRKALLRALLFSPGFILVSAVLGVGFGGVFELQLHSWALWFELIFLYIGAVIAIELSYGRRSIGGR